MGWRWGFVALAILGLLYAPGLRMGMKNLPPRDSSASTAARPAQVLGGRCFQALALAFFSVCAMLWILYAWLPSLIYERYRLSLADSGFTATVWLQASSAAGILSGGVLADWLSRRMAAGRFYVVAAGLLLCSPFAYLSLAAPSLDGLKFACAAFGLFAGVMLSNVVAAAYDVTGPENYGFSAGALTLIGGLAGGLGILSMGRWKASLGAGTLMGWAAAAGVVSALALAWVVAARFRFERYQRPSAKE
ncbi:MAG: MFS transporter [Acidobacteria bacterium]|nr:MFS transporter [Acidobacteriota bacterium]